MSKYSQRDYDSIENRLQATLQPVPPRPEFVGNLRSKLVYELHNPGTYTELGPGKFILLVVISLLSVIMIVMMSLRAIALFLSALGLLGQFWKQFNQKRPQRLRSAG